MPSRISIISVAVLLFVLISCKKSQSKQVPGCFANATTTRQISNKQATIRIDAGQALIVEDGIIDSRLLPCELQNDFKQDGLRVIVSGDVKNLVQSPSGPCCLYNFFITHITR